MEEGTVVLADEQTAGRGRFGRSWVSPPGRSIHMTVVLRPPTHRLRSLGLLAPVAIARAVETVTDLQPAIKWPNDVVVGQRKVSRELLLLALFRELEELYLASLRGESAQPEWRRRLVTLGREVRVSSGDRVEEGVAEDADANGDLILRRTDGSRITVSAGDVTLRA
ncbi:MAG: biotin--[acetyl-CoA-carboxylase] ligase [Dehalococcoidia bacterium]